MVTLADTTVVDLGLSPGLCHWLRLRAGARSSPKVIASAAVHAAAARIGVVPGSGAGARSWTGPDVKRIGPPGVIRILYMPSSSRTSSQFKSSPSSTDSLSSTMRAPIPSTYLASNSVYQGNTDTTCGEDHTGTSKSICSRTSWLSRRSISFLAAAHADPLRLLDHSLEI
ncbi:hypothetical protein BJV74DRAFT_832898 [Russula compacta]|nr:hypothetical protein BJV74DRAFT_832898 [Russula compacta]